MSKIIGRTNYSNFGRKPEMPKFSFNDVPGFGFFKVFFVLVFVLALVGMYVGATDHKTYCEVFGRDDMRCIGAFTNDHNATPRAVIIHQD